MLVFRNCPDLVQFASNLPQRCLKHPEETRQNAAIFCGQVAANMWLSLMALDLQANPNSCQSLESYQLDDLPAGELTVLFLVHYRGLGFCV